METPEKVEPVQTQSSPSQVEEDKFKDEAIPFVVYH